MRQGWGCVRVGGVSRLGVRQLWGASGLGTNSTLDLNLTDPLASDLDLTMFSTWKTKIALVVHSIVVYYSGRKGPPHQDRSFQIRVKILDALACSSRCCHHFLVLRRQIVNRIWSNP